MIISKFDASFITNDLKKPFLKVNETNRTKVADYTEAICLELGM